jgi:UDP-glucose 4-epimerase
MRVLVTGGAGFIGTGVCAELRSRGHEPVIFGRTQRPDTESILGDTRDPVAVTEAIAHTDACIHLAGVLGTAETIWNPYPAVETNILGGINVLEACSQYQVPLVNIAVGNHFENSPYAITKTTVERFVKMYAQYRDLPACSVRTFNVYGPGQSVAQPYGSSRVRKIIPSFIARALHGEPVQVYGDGSQVMNCLVTALEKGPRNGQVHNAGTGRRTTVKEIAVAAQHEVQRQAGMMAPVEFLPMRQGETPGSEVRAEPDLVRLTLGLEPDDFVLLQDGLVNTVAFYRELFT